MKYKIIKILESAETEDMRPPFRALPVGHPKWIEAKADKILSLPIMIPCPECEGEGNFDHHNIKAPCEKCSGTGSIPLMRKGECEGFGNFDLCTERNCRHFEFLKWTWGCTIKGEVEIPVTVGMAIREAK